MNTRLTCVSLTSVTFAVIAMLSRPVEAADNLLFGTWRVTSFKLQIVGEPGERDILGSNPKGYIIITPEPRLMAFLAADGRRPPTNQAEAAAMLQSMIAYTGRITLEPDKFTTDVEVSWNQVDISTPQVRFYTVSENKLTIQGPEQDLRLFPGKRGTAILTFERQR
jgi:hypothetical protein